MDAGTVVRLLAILLAPTAVAAGVLGALHAGRLLAARRRRTGPLPAGPPLEQTAAALRRLLAEHEQIRHSPGVAVRGSHLAALEGAITDCALDAARALDVEPPRQAGRAPLPREQLRQLLRRLVERGLLLPDWDRFGR